MDIAASVRAAQLPPPNVRRLIRISAGVSLRECAVELKVTPMTVLRWERGESVPRREHAIAYRKLLDAIKQAAAS